MKQAISLAIASDNKLDDQHSPLTDYLRYNNTLCLLRQLNPLINVLQRHRGISTAYLSGESSFEVTLTTLEKEIASRFSQLNLLNSSFDYVIPKQQWSSIENEYDALMSHWRSDDAMTNFEFHSHFIELIIKLLPEISATVVDYTLPITPQEKLKESVLLSDVTFTSTPLLVEAMAKIRGLITHVSVTKTISPPLRSRVAFLLQSIVHNKNTIRDALSDIQTSTVNSMPRLFDTLLHEHKMTQFHQLISEEFLSESINIRQSQQVFDFVSDVIDAYSSITALGINLLQQKADYRFAHARS